MSMIYVYLYVINLHTQHRLLYPLTTFKTTNVVWERDTLPTVLPEYANEEVCKEVQKVSNSLKHKRSLIG